MPAGTVITDDIKRDIARIYYRDETQPAKTILAELHRELGRDDWPKLSVIQREVKRIKDNKDKGIELDKELDNPWNLGLLAKPEYNIPPEAVPYIQLAQDLTERALKPPYNEPFEPLTIRQALWLARLYIPIRNRFWNQNQPKKKKDLPKLYGKLAYELWRWANAYANYEIICHLSSTPFETSELDKKLLQGAMPFAVVTMEDDKYPSILFFQDKNGIPTVSRIIGKGIYNNERTPTTEK